MGQMGYPPTMLADAQLGYPVMSRQSPEILFDSCGGGGSILVRPEGFCARAHPGTKNELRLGDARQSASALRDGRVFERTSTWVDTVEHIRTPGGAKKCSLHSIEAAGAPSVQLGFGSAVPFFMPAPPLSEKLIGPVQEK